MTFSLKEIFGKLARVKNIGLISAILVLGILMCTLDSLPAHDTGGGVERDIAKLCSQVIGEKPYVSVNTDGSGSIVGIAVVFDGAEQPDVKLKITEMLSTLYDIPSSRVYVTS
ncbi:MAG: hypothetical protein IJ391_06645 [Clostridia bacterium]|nr:hypothetical protein [Clostridia bacterium]